jgi:hypothetical protein
MSKVDIKNKINRVQLLKACVSIVMYNLLHDCEASYEQVWDEVFEECRLFHKVTAEESGEGEDHKVDMYFGNDHVRLPIKDIDDQLTEVLHDMMVDLEKNSKTFQDKMIIFR